MSLSSTSPFGIPGDLPVVFSLVKYRGSAWWTIYFPYLESKLEFKASSAIGDSSTDSTGGLQLGGTLVEGNLDIHIWVPSFWIRRILGNYARGAIWNRAPII